MKTTTHALLALGLFTLLSLPARSQDSTMTTVADTVAVDPFLGFMMLNFQFERPDSSFRKMQNAMGFENEAGARVTYQLFPAPFAQVMKDFSKKGLGGADSVLIQRKATVNGVSGFLVKMLYRSPDANHEDHYGLFFLFPYQNGTINMVSVYPASIDLVVYANILKSFGTIKEIKGEELTVKH